MAGKRENLELLFSRAHFCVVAVVVAESPAARALKTRPRRAPVERRAQERQAQEPKAAALSRRLAPDGGRGRQRRGGGGGTERGPTARRSRPEISGRIGSHTCCAPARAPLIEQVFDGSTLAPPPQPPPADDRARAASWRGRWRRGRSGAAADRGHPRVSGAAARSAVCGARAACGTEGLPIRRGGGRRGEINAAANAADHNAGDDEGDGRFECPPRPSPDTRGSANGPQALGLCTGVDPDVGDAFGERGGGRSSCARDRARRVGLGRRGRQLGGHPPRHLGGSRCRRP